MIDKRKCYKMESGYGQSDFSFYEKFPESAKNVCMYSVLAMQNKAGHDRWYCVDSYVYRSPRNTGFTDNVLVLVNDDGDQIETSGFGWYSVLTEHDLAMREKKEYNDFAKQLANLKVPKGLSRFHSEIIELFENQYEEVLYYGEE